MIFVFLVVFIQQINTIGYAYYHNDGREQAGEKSDFVSQESKRSHDPNHDYSNNDHRENYCFNRTKEQEQYKSGDQY